jgi:hypothetical protein
MTKIYERSDGVVYVRDFGQEPSTRVPVTDVEQTSPIFRHAWMKILTASQTNPALRDALLNAIMIYELTKKQDE